MPGDSNDEKAMFLDNKVEVNLINTNARSLRPKLKSFVQCFINLSLVFAIVTETWLAHGSRLERDVEGLLLGEGLVVHYLNRLPSPNGVTHGGVAIILKNDRTTSAIYTFPNPDSFEVLPVSTKLHDITRKFFIIAVYIPPGYSAGRGAACLRHISDLVLDIKRRASNNNEPFVIIAGDFNQWDIAGALTDFPELMEVETPATRGDRHIDKIFTNWSGDITDAGCVPPLETDSPLETRTYSDHVIQYACSRIQGKPPAAWESYSYRPFCEKSAVGFVNDLAKVDWNDLYRLENSNNMAVHLQVALDGLMDRHFPMKTIKKKDSDLPWFNETARKMTKKKQAIYKSEGKSERWVAISEKVDKYLEKGRTNFLSNQRDKITDPKTNAQFFKNVKAFSGVDKPADFNIKDLRPGKTEQEIANEAASFFKRISDEFLPLEPDQIPATYHRDLPLLSPAQVQKMLTDAKKTSSMVQGDIFPCLINRCSALLAWPLSAIYNQIIRSFIWPTHWKREHVTIIPKKNKPNDFADLRNISCTLFFSKVFERYVLALLQEETTMKENQFGGVKNCSTTHMVITILQEICENAEDYRSATVLCAIDFAKAFNRMSFQHCLEALRKKNASTPILRLIATFLTNRTMTVRVGTCWSDPLPVSGGCPQGSILGVELFNNTTEDLEERFMDFEKRRMGNQEPVAEQTPAPEAEVSTLYNATTSTPDRNARICLDDSLSPISAPPDIHAVRAPKVILKDVARPTLVDPPAEQSVGTQVLTEKPVKIVKYVDDIVTVDKVNFGTTPITVQADGSFKIKISINTSNAFVSISNRAEEIGMIVNAKKTKLITISDALNFRPRANILDQQGNIITSGTTMNILGFQFSDRPNVNAHVTYVAASMRRKYWSLYHLRRVGFNTEELVKVYKSVLLPIADYCSPAYHPMMTDIQDQELERVQIGALRAIFGYDRTAAELRRGAGVTTLRERRIRLTDKFAQKCLQNDRFKAWFPENEGRRSARQGEKYKEFFAKTDRLKNSPLFYMRRRLNGKEGKVYGERNRKYRENFSIE